MNNNLLLYRCKGCQLILTNSIYLLSDMEDWNGKFFKRAIVKKSDEWETSSSSFDKYCTYYRLFCPSCEADLGKYYKALTRELSIYHNTAFLFTESIEEIDILSFTKLKPTPSFSFEPILNEEIITGIVLEEDITYFDPLQDDLVSVYYKEYKMMKRTVQLAEEAEIELTKALLFLEQRLMAIEKHACKARKLYKHLAKTLQLAKD